MLAAAGWPLAELWHGPLAKITGSPYALNVTQGRSLSVLNGGLGEVAPFLFLVAAVIAAIEIATLDQVPFEKRKVRFFEHFFPRICGKFVRNFDEILNFSEL